MVRKKKIGREWELGVPRTYDGGVLAAHGRGLARAAVGDAADDGDGVALHPDHRVGGDDQAE